MRFWFELLGDVLGVVLILAIMWGLLVIGHGLGF